MRMALPYFKPVLLTFFSWFLFVIHMKDRENRALQVPPVVQYKTLGNFSKALYGTTRGTCSSLFFRPVIGKA